MKQEKRFVRVHTESSGFEVSSIWVDRKTGVSYFWHSSGNAGGLTGHGGLLTSWTFRPPWRSASWSYG